MIPEQGCSRENSLLGKIFVELVSTFWDFQRVGAGGGGGGGGFLEKNPYCRGGMDFSGTR